MRNLTLVFLFLLLIQPPLHPAQNQTNNKNKIYRNGWIDLNKNGRMDVYENPKAPIEKRIDDLLSQMNVDEKTCQTATLAGRRWRSP